MRGSVSCYRAGCLYAVELVDAQIIVAARQIVAADYPLILTHDPATDGMVALLSKDIVDAQ